MCVLLCDELVGVIVYELVYIKYCDMLIMMVMVIMVGVIVMLGNMMMFFVMFGGWDNCGGVLVLIFVMVFVFIVVGLVQMVILWLCEYEVDWIGVEICGKFMVFVGVLVKILCVVGQVVNILVECNLVVVLMYIVNLLYVMCMDWLFVIYFVIEDCIVWL